MTAANRLGADERDEAQGQENLRTLIPPGPGNAVNCAE
jgi:hypothetical protein